MGFGGTSATLFAELVPRVSGREIAASAVGRCGPGLARAVCEAFASSDCRGTAGACAARPDASPWASYQRRQGSRDAAVASLPAYARVWRARLQRRYSGKEAASGASAAGAATTLSEAVSLRVRRRFSGGFGDGEESWSSCYCRARAISDGEETARGTAGFFARIDSGIT